MASAEEIAGSAPTHRPLRNLLIGQGKLRNPSQWRAAEMCAMRISFASFENAVPADHTQVAEIDTRALATIFNERDERGAGSLSVNQAFAIAIDALEDRDIHMGCEWFYVQLGKRVALLLPEFYIMVYGVYGSPAVAVNNPCSVYFEHKQNRTVDHRISYFPGADIRDVDPVNVAQLIIVAQGVERGNDQ